MPRKLENLVGKSFGYLTVESYAGLVKSGKQKQSAWKCRCICGTEKIIPNNRLKTGNAKSCKCLHKEIVTQVKDLTGQKFNMITVISFFERTKTATMWNCKCDCGNDCIISSCSLIAGQQSCGCKQGWWRSEKPGLWKNRKEYALWQRKDPVKKIRHGVSSSIRTMIKNNASYKRKKSILNYLPYTIEELKTHLENLWEDWMSWDNYGGSSDDQNKTWWIDHIIPHSNFPYKSMDCPMFLDCWKLDNLRPLEKTANMSKGNKII